MSHESETARRSFGRFLKEKFGCRVYKVSVDAGFSCPNRDGAAGTGGCIYCNNSSFRPESASRLKPIGVQIEEGIAYLRQRYGASKFIAYFQPYTNTYAPLEVLTPLYESALAHPDVVGLSVGTRPDCIDDDKLAWFEKLAATRFVTLEYGLQSIYDSSLERIHRGHDFASWVNAMNRTRDRGIWLCTHLILGLPWETREEMVRSADAISTSGLSFLKLHHLQVIRDTLLERLYREAPFPLLELDEYARLVADFVERLDPSIYIERYFGSAPEDLLVAPLWGKSAAEIRRAIESAVNSRRVCRRSG